MINYYPFRQRDKPVKEAIKAGRLQAGDEIAIAELRNSIPVVDLCTGEEEERATYVKHHIAILTQAREMRRPKETVAADKPAMNPNRSKNISK